MQTVRFTNKLVVLLFIVGVLFSCTRKIRSSKISLDDINVQQCEFDYFKGKSKVHFENDEQSLNATLNIRIKQDSAIWLSVTAMVEVVRTVITKDSVFFYQKLPEKTYKEFSIAELSRMSGVALDYHMLESIFFGNVQVYDKKAANIDVSEQSYTISESYDAVDIVSILDKNSGKLNELRIADKEKVNTATIDFAKYSADEECKVPMAISFVTQQQVSEDTTLYNNLELKYSKVKFLSEAVSFPFNRTKYAK